MASMRSVDELLITSIVGGDVSPLELESMAA
jgi:hypothetical protein